MKKHFALGSEQIQHLVPNLGACFATDKITVSGSRVGYMVREKPDRQDDSGWVFMEGTETQEYLDNPDNASVFDVNTIANYDPEIIPYLLYPTGSEIERGSDGNFCVINGPKQSPDVTLLYPAFPGVLQVTETWSFRSTYHLLRRIDRGSMVLWRPGFTIWLTAYTDSSPRPAEERLASWRASASPERYGDEVARDRHQIRYRYRLEEPRENGGIQAAVYCFAFTQREEVHLSIYYDSDDHIAEIDGLWSTLKCES